MPNNEWYEYSSEEMQHLGDEPGDILGLVMHDYEPANDNEQSQEKGSPRVHVSQLATPARTTSWYRHSPPVTAPFSYTWDG